MLATLIPLFNEKMAVCAYSLFSQKENTLMNPLLISTGSNTGVGQIDGFEIIDTVGISTFSSDKDIFVPVNSISIFTNIEETIKTPHSRLVLMMDYSVTPTEMFIKRIWELKKSGFRFAISKLQVKDFEAYKPILMQMDYMYLDYTKIDITKATLYFKSVYPGINLIAENIQSMDDFNVLCEKGGYHFYEGPFYRLPVTKGETEVAPLKINYIDLLNTVNNPDFDLTEVADIVSRDTALVISLLKIVNTISRNSKITSIRHAAAMLGQKELKKWITTAVAKELCFDKPNEITRLSLLRAKFAENLAPTFHMEEESQELFLTGLFSVLDIILDKPMEESLELVNVSKEISNALLIERGSLYDVLYFIKQYEAANFSEINRIEIVDHIDMSNVYTAYKESLEWLNVLFDDNQ